MKNDFDDLCAPKETNEDNDYDSADHDFGPPDFEMPENSDMNIDGNPHGEKVSKLDIDISPYSTDCVSVTLGPM